MPVYADGDQGEGAKKDGDGLGVADERAECAAERPVLEKDVGDKCERHTDGGHQHVGARQVQYEPVGHCSHATFSYDDSDDERVAANRDDDDDQVESNEQDTRVDRKQVRVDDHCRVTVHRCRRIVLYIHGRSAIICLVFGHLTTGRTCRSTIIFAFSL